MDFIFLIGQTGVGKSTTLDALLRSEQRLVLLPNRRKLADDIIIPQMQTELGEAVGAVSDRVERFRLTAAYREKNLGGMVHALQTYFSNAKLDKAQTYVFDNIRGLEECTAALEHFPASRFIFLNAPPFIRLQRLLVRSDSFDEVAAERPGNTLFTENLEEIDNASDAFDFCEIARLEANSNYSDEAILKAVRIISAEFKNYNADAAATYLMSRLDKPQLLYLDTSKLSIDEVSSRIQGWL